MVDYGVAISLTIIAILALFTDILAIFVIAHYFPFFHGTDVTLTSLMCAMAGNAILVLPIPAFLEILDTPWTPGLCTGYVWGFLTFRLSQMLSLAILTIHWSTLLKVSADKKGYFSTKLLKISVVFVWLSSVIFGCLPLIGVANNSYNEHQTCKFLSFNVGPGFGLFFIIANIACMLVSIICATDATFLIKHMRRIAKTKYNTGRFHLPDSRADIPGQVINFITERYHRLNFAWDLSRFVLVFVLLAFLLNHLPYTIIQGLQVFTQIDRGTLEVISLYLIGAEALIVPHSLWLLSKRYRHGLSYLWRVHILRKHDEKEEDPCSCLQQSYTQREKDRVSVAPSRPPSSQGRAGGYNVSASGTLRSTKSDVMARELLQQPNGRAQIATIPSPQTHKHVVQMNGVVRSEVKVDTHNHSYDERAIDTKGLEVHRVRTPILSEGSTNRTGLDHSTRSADGNIRDTFAVSRLDVKRSSSGASSGASRKEWKEHMRLKHLPPIFVNDGFEKGDKKPVTIKIEDAAVRQAPLAEGGNSLHYYMSSDYHPDYLTDSLPRHKLAQALSLDSEEDGSNNRHGRTYEDTDIDEVLSASSPTDEHYWIKRREQFVNSFKDGNQRPAMSTFKAPIDDYRVFSVDKPDTAIGKGVYGTFEDLSVTDIADQNEIVFNVGSIPADHMREGYNSLRRIKRKEGDMIGTDLQNGLNHSFSGRTCESSTPTNSPDFRSLGRSKKRYLTNPVYPMHNAAPQNPTQTGDRFYYSFSNYNTNTEATNPNPNYSSNTNIVPETSDSNVVFQTDTSRHVYSGTGLFRSDSRRLSDRFSLEEEESPSTSQPNSSNTSSNTGSHQIPSSSIEGDNDDSSGSNSSVTISPYKEGLRHKPWLEDIERHHVDRTLLQMTEPLCGGESDTDTLKDSHDSIELRISDGKLIHSNTSTPVSSLFDEETDRGFEEALDQHVTLTPGASVYGGVGLCFESIKEEPEDLTSSGSNPFLDNLSNGDDEFRTRAVVSRGSNYDSRPSSVTSVDKDDNPFLQNNGGVAPPTSGTDYKYSNKVSSYLFNDTEYDFEHADSGFTSGLERGNWSDSSGYQDTITPRAENVSPWPDNPDVVSNSDNAYAFESNFCGRVPDIGSYTDNNRRGSSQFKRSQFTQNQVPSVEISDKSFKKQKSDKNVQLSKSTGSRIVHRGVHRLVSGSGQSIVRVRSMDDHSPIAPRKQPKRVSSFEIQSNVRPAYF